MFCFKPKKKFKRAPCLFRHLFVQHYRILVCWSYLAISLRDFEALHIGKLLVVVIVHNRLVLVPLCLLGSPVTDFYRAKLAFRVTIGEELLTAHMLGLERPQLVLLFFGLFQHFDVLALKLALMFDTVDLSIEKTFEMVGLYAMRGKHGLLSLLVLRHEVVRQGEVNLTSSFTQLFNAFCIVLITLLLGQLLVGINNGKLHSLSLRVVNLLRLLEHLSKMITLLFFHVLLELFLFFQKPLLALLLIDPVSLL